MAGCTRIAGAALLAAVTSGCVTGHLWQAGRRWERASSFRQASIDGDRLVVRYEAQVTDDAGEALALRPRRAALSLASLRVPRFSAEDAIVEPVEDAGTLPGHEVPVATVPPPTSGAPVSLLVRDARVAVAIPGNVFTRTSTAAWVYPLLPLAFCVDATSVPVLLFFAPGAMVIGD